jgi:hypothetical protein
MRTAALTLLACALLPPFPGLWVQPWSDFVPVGVRYDLDPDPVRRRTDLENMRRLRFTVVAVGRLDEPAGFVVRLIDRVLAGDPDPSTVPASSFGVVAVRAETAAASIREAAWSRFAAAASGVIFDDWHSLQRNEGALAEAAAFADSLARNPALYAPLRRVAAAGDRALRIDGAEGSVEAQWLESDDTLMLIAINHAAEPREVTLTFAPAIPEAIWQNMLTGGAVNFVAGPDGPVYERRLGPSEVLVLMIRKQLK